MLVEFCCSADMGLFSLVEVVSVVSVLVEGVLGVALLTIVLEVWLAVAKPLVPVVGEVVVAPVAADDFSTVCSAADCSVPVLAFVLVVAAESSTACSTASVCRVGSVVLMLLLSPHADEQNDRARQRRMTIKHPDPQPAFLESATRAPLS